jgi:hypothetical protein
MYQYNCIQTGQYENLLEKTNVQYHMVISFINNAAGIHDCACPRLILRLLNQQQVARMYDVAWPLELSSKCYLAAFIAILAFLM